MQLIAKKSHAVKDRGEWRVSEITNRSGLMCLGVGSVVFEGYSSTLRRQYGRSIILANFTSLIRGDLDRQG